MNRSVTSTEPILATRPRSLRSRSTIIKFSARCFSSMASQVLRRASSRGVRPRGAVPFIGRVDMCLPSRRKNSSGDSDSTSSSARVDQRAIGHALLAPERGIERDRIALEGEAIFHREVDLIDVAGGDVILDRSEGAVILLARPGQLEAGDLGALGGAVRIEPSARGLDRRADEAARNKPIQNSGTRRSAGSRSFELRLEAIAELVGEEAGRVQPARQPRGDLVERGIDLLRRVSGDDPLGLGIEQAPAARRQAVVEKDVRGSGHLSAQSHDFPLGSQA